MINTSLFIACFITLAANPSLVASIPLPAHPSGSHFVASYHRRGFNPFHRPRPTLRIVDDEEASTPTSWMQTFTPEFVVEQSIFDANPIVEAELNALVGHRPHHHGTLHTRTTKMKRSLNDDDEQSTTNAKKKGKKAKRSNVHSPSSAAAQREKRYSERRIQQQRAAASRSAAAAASRAAATATSSISSLVWTKVSTTAAPVATSTLESIISSPSTATTTAGSASSTSTSVTHIGEGTWFAPGLGACGTTAYDSSPIVAVSHLLYDSYPGATLNPNLNPICGKQIKATYAGRSVVVTVQDRCEGCAVNDLDFSPEMFGQLADLGVGRLKGVEWTWV